MKKSISMVSVIFIIFNQRLKRKLCFYFYFYCLKTIGSADWVVVVVMLRDAETSSNIIKLHQKNIEYRTKKL